MRTIKFRGKTVFVDRWVYGGILQRESRIYIIEPNANIIDSKLNKIDPKTVGQFTGLYDKNGKEIYEGDIVLIESVVFDNEYAVVEWEELSCRYIFRIANDDGYLSPLDCRDEIVVIGNIYDNPELLKGGEE